MLNLFFSEYLVELAKEKFQDMYVVFAGGDDLFVVGPWHQTIAFAIELREKLSLFCAENKDITLSAGILVGKPRMPMRKAAELAEEALEKAKAAPDEALEKAKAAPDKDSVCVFGETAKWDELEQLIEWGKKFDKALEDKERTGFSTAFLYRLLTYHRMYRQFKREDQSKIRFGRYLSLAHYDIGRNIRKEKYDNQKELNMLLHIFAVSYSKPQGIERLNIPLYYAINLNRSN
jgi:CRISPR-associated protein Csm1